MQKLIQKYLVANCVAFFVELILCLVLFFLTDGGWFRTYIVEIIYAFAAIIILVNLIISLITFAKLSKAKNKSDITTLKVLGNDIQVAYDFGMIGLIITDDDNNVIWANDLVESRGMRIRLNPSPLIPRSVLAICPFNVPSTTLIIFP